MNKSEPLAKQLKLVKIGNSVGVILPKDMLARHNLTVGDALSCNDTPDGFQLSARAADFEEQMVEARKLMKQYRNALSELAK